MKNLKGLEAPVKRAALALAVAALVQAGPALAALELRDINGNATVVEADAEFAYDTVLDATWYLTGNNTGLIWEDAKSWAAGLTVGTFSGWSLPAADPTCTVFNCTNSQMGELYYTALGNAAGGPLSNTGPFKNLESFGYWSGQDYALDPFYPPPSNGNLAWFFDFSNGGQTGAPKFFHAYGLNALAVRPGDVAVPEPGMVALLLSGLAGVLVMRRRPVGA